MLTCSTCENEITKTDKRINLLTNIFICKECVYKILTMYVYLNPIKVLCPICLNDKKIKCEYCDIPKKMEIFKYENI